MLIYVIVIVYLLIILLYAIFNSRCNDLARQVSKSGRADAMQQMSRLLEELKGKRCVIYVENNYQPTIEGMVADVDENFVKIELLIKKSGATHHVVPISGILSVEVK